MKKLAGEEHLTRRPGSQEWQISFTVAGKRVRQSAGTADKRLAAAAATKLHGDLYRSLVLREAPAAVDMTWVQASARYREEVSRHTSYGRSSQIYVLNVLDAVIGSLPLRDVTETRVADVAERLRAPRPRPSPVVDSRSLSPATVNRYIAALAVVCQRAREVWGVHVGAWNAANHRLKEPVGRETFLDQEQARRLMGEACGHLRPILLLELLTGLRMRNVVGLQWETISLDLGRALLIQKGGRRLRVELPQRAVKLLEDVQPDPRKRHGPVFRFGNPACPCRCPHCASPQYRDLPIRDIRRSFGGAARRAGVLWNGQTRLRFHDLRHTFASWLLAETGNLQLVREALGHAQVATTQRYAHLLPGQRAEAAEAVSARLEDRLRPPGRIKA